MIITGSPMFLDGSVFPRNPLTKLWRPALQGGFGNSEPILSGLWTLDLNFGILESVTQVEFFENAYQAGGLHTARLPHPQTGQLHNFSGVAIEDLSHTFDEWDSDAYNSDTILRLSNLAISTLAQAEPTVSGSYQIGGVLPKDPLTKRWQRQKIASGGRGAVIHSNLWQLQLSFGTLKIAEHGVLFRRFVTGGLYDAFLTHPTDGALTSFTGVSILDYGWSFTDVEDNAYAISPTITLGVTNVQDIPAGWWNTAWTARQCLTVTTVGSAVGADYTLRFYISGSAATTIYNAAQADEDNVRVIYQNLTDLDRDVDRWIVGEVEVLFPVQTALSSSEINNKDYCLYYKHASGTAAAPDKDFTNVYPEFYDGIENDVALSEWSPSSSSEFGSGTTAEAFAGSWSMVHWLGSDESAAKPRNKSIVNNPISPTGTGFLTPNNRIEWTWATRVTGTQLNPFPGLDGTSPIWEYSVLGSRGPTSQGKLFSVFLSTGSAITYQNTGSTGIIDSGATFNQNTWHKFEMDINWSSQKVWLRQDNLPIVSKAAMSFGAGNGFPEEPFGVSLTKIGLFGTGTAAFTFASFDDEFKWRLLAENEPTVTGQAEQTI